jgi:hypothetical protein
MPCFVPISEIHLQKGLFEWGNKSSHLNQEIPSKYRQGVMGLLAFWRPQLNYHPILGK